MILPDVNLLVYAYNASAPQHEKAANWWKELVRSGQPVGISWPVLQGFIRVLSGRHVVAVPYTCAEVFGVCEQWWEQANVGLLAPSRETYLIFRALVEKYDLAGGATTDALIASFALEHKAKLASNDADFLRFQELRVVNPLKGS